MVCRKKGKMYNLVRREVLCLGLVVSQWWVICSVISRYLVSALISYCLSCCMQRVVLSNLFLAPMDLFPHCSNSVTSQILLCADSCRVEHLSDATWKPMDSHSLWDHVSTVTCEHGTIPKLSVHDAQCEGEKGVLARVMSSQRCHMTLLTSREGLFPCGGGRSHALELIRQALISYMHTVWPANSRAT